MGKPMAGTCGAESIQCPTVGNQCSLYYLVSIYIQVTAVQASSISFFVVQHDFVLPSTFVIYKHIPISQLPK